MAVRIAVLVTLALAPGAALAAHPNEGPKPSSAVPVRVQGSWAGIKLIRQLMQQYESDLGAHFITFWPRDTDQVPGALEKHECDVGMMLDCLAPKATKGLDRRFETFPIGRLVVHVAVNARSPIRMITLEELRDVFSGRIVSWNKISHSGSLGRIELFGPLLTSTEASIFQKKAMRGAGFARSLRDRPAKGGHQKLSTAEIIGAVGTQPRAIGFFLQASERELDTRVRILKIAKDKTSKAVAPSVGAVADGSYPLWDTLTLYLRPDAPPQAREFCKFASGAEAVKIVKQFEMWPECELEQPRGEQNLAQVTRGKAETVLVCDLTGNERLLNDLAVDFMKTRTAVRLDIFKGLSRHDAIEKLTTGTAELLLTGEPLTEGEGTKAEGRAPAPTPTSSQKNKGESRKCAPLRGIELGRMGVGIVVHSGNPLESLPLDEARSIFSGEIRKWPAVRGAAPVIHVFGLKHNHPVTQLLKEKLAVAKALSFKIRPDNEKVIVSVARDPAAIGFVDLSQWSATEKSVKLVPVLPPSQTLVKQSPGEDANGAKGGEGPREGHSRPAALQKGERNAVGESEVEKVPNPLERTLALYVSPNASQTAKDFADFLTPEHCKETLAQYNLFPPVRSEDARQRSEWAKAMAEFDREQPQNDLASVGEPPPLLLDDPNAPKDHGREKSKKVSASPKPEAHSPEAASPRPKEASDAKPTKPSARRPRPPEEPSNAPSFSTEQAIWLGGGIVGVVLLGVGWGWLSAPKRKKNKRPRTWNLSNSLPVDPATERDLLSGRELRRRKMPHGKRNPWV